MKCVAREEKSGFKRDEKALDELVHVSLMKERYLYFNLWDIGRWKMKSGDMKRKSCGWN